MENNIVMELDEQRDVLIFLAGHALSGILAGKFFEMVLKEGKGTLGEAVAHEAVVLAQNILDIIDNEKSKAPSPPVS